MKQITYQDIMKFGPCYDPIKHIPDNYSGTSAEILSLKQVPAKDRLWLAVRAELLTDKQIQQFALFCARQCEANSTDARVKDCNDTVESFFKGEATREQLSAADAAACAASDARFVASSVASLAARSVASFAARSAAYAARSAASAAEEKQCEFLIELLTKGDV